MKKKLINVRNLAQFENNEKSNLLANIIDYAVDGLITFSSTGVVESFNPAAERIFGYKDIEANGLYINVLIPEFFDNICAIKIGAGQELEGRHKDGKMLPISCGVSEIQLDNDGRLFSITIRDVTASKIMEKTLKQSGERFQLAIAGSNNGIWDWNVITDEAYFSPQFKKMLGYEENEIGDKFEEWSERLHPDDKEAILELLQTHLMIHKEAYDVEYRLKMKSKEYKWFRTKGQAVWDENGKPLRMAGSLSDISKRKAVEEELLAAKEYAEEMAEDLLAANKEAQVARVEAERATQMKSEFLANMSHEIRTPMNGVMGMTSLLLETELTTTQQGQVEIIYRSGEALMEIINDILDISKIEAGKLTLESLPFNLQDDVVEMIELLTSRCLDKSIELILRYAPNTPEFILGDSGRIRQILLNLVGNSIKFTDSGHVFLNIEAKEITENNAIIHFEITDTGIGIDEDIQRKLFDKFMQADASTTRKYGGTGLGLAICRLLVEMMGGKIGVKSKKGEGSTFWFTIPFPLANTEKLSKKTECNVSNSRVLMVNESSINCKVMCEYVNAKGLICDIVGSDKEAIYTLKKAKENGKPYEIALLNHKIPEMDKRSLVKNIKNDEDIKDTIFIAIVLGGVRGDIIEAEEQGLSAYLVRPFRSSVITDSIALLLDAKRDGKLLPIITRHTFSDSPLMRRLADSENISFDAHILIAEDNLINQIMVTQMLELLGCKVSIANNGKEAVDMAQEGSYDLILMDCMMPEMNGFEATGYIRKFSDEKKNINIIALTANALQNARKECIDSGMNDYLSKPVKKIELRDILVKWLHKTNNIIQVEKNEGKIDNMTSFVGGEDIIEMPVFNIFLELLGDKSADILNTHCGIAKGYIEAIRKCLDEGKYKDMACSAHPLKSSSAQIGAVKVAKIAAKIEEIGNSSFSNIDILNDLINELEEQQTLLQEFIINNFTVRRSA